MRIQGTPLFLREGLKGMLGRVCDIAGHRQRRASEPDERFLGNVSMQLLALEPQEYAEIAWFRDDLRTPTWNRS